MGLLRVLAGPEGCAHPEPSPAALGDLQRVRSRCSPRQGWYECPQPRAEVAVAAEQRHLLCPAPKVGQLQDAQSKSGWRGQLPSPSPSASSSRGTGAAEPAQGAPPAASFLPRQDQRLGLTWTPFY